MDAAKRIRDAVSYLRREVSPEIGLQFLIIFFEVAVQDGITQHELTQSTGIGVGTISRNTNKVADAYGLISISPHPTEYRRMACYLTPKGKRILADLTKILWPSR